MKDLSPINNKGQMHGYWKYMITPEIIAYEGEYNNDIQVGLWITYSHDKHNDIMLKKYIIK